MEMNKETNKFFTEFENLSFEELIDKKQKCMFILSNMQLMSEDAVSFYSNAVETLDYLIGAKHVETE